MHRTSFAPVAASLFAAGVFATSAAAQVIDLGGACAGSFVPPSLTAAIQGSTVNIALASPGAPYSSISLGVVMLGFSAANVTLPCGCILGPSLDSLLVAGFFTAPATPTIPLVVPVGLTGVGMLLQGVEFFDPAAPIAANARCLDFGLAFNFSNAVGVLLP